MLWKPLSFEATDEALLDPLEAPLQEQVEVGGKRLK